MTRRVEDELFSIMENHKISWERALALSYEQRALFLEQEPASAGPQGADAPVDDYAGPQEDDVVGDERRVRVLSVGPMNAGESVVVGEAWQSEDGMLHGSGVAAVMFFEPMAMSRYRGASLAMDVSPLTVFYGRIARSPFLQAEFIESSNGTSQ